MDDPDIQPRGGLTTKHILFAIFLAVIIAGAGFLWMLERAQKSASAVLAFDSTAVQHLYPGLMAAREPAVALADSILNDSTVAQLAKQAHLSASATAAQIGEFRASLDLTEGSAQQLVVRFDDAAPAHWATILPPPLLEIETKSSVATANGVARVLAAWSPSPAARPASAPPSGAQFPSPGAASASAVKAAGSGTAGSAVPAPAPAPTSPSAAHAVADGLGDVETLLLTTDHDLARLGATTGRGGPYANAHAQSDQQRLLRTQVRTAEAKLDQLRAQAATEEMKAHLGVVREAVHRVLTAGLPQQYGFNTAGTSAGELRRERAALRDAIAVVERERRATEPKEPAQANAGSGNAAPAQRPGAVAPAAGSLSSTPAPAASASGAMPSNSATSSLQEQNLSPVGIPNSRAPSGIGHPLTIVRLASPPASPRPWIPIAVGVLCGFLSLGLAALTHRHGSYEDGYEDPEISYRFITPAGPLRQSIDPVSTAEVSAPETPLPEEAPRRRASFALDWSASENEAPSKSALPGGGTLMVHDEESALKKGAPDTNEDDAELVGRLKRSISETTIGRMFETSESEAANQPPVDRQTDTAEPNRRAG